MVELRRTQDLAVLGQNGGPEQRSATNLRTVLSVETHVDPTEWPFAILESPDEINYAGSDLYSQFLRLSR